MDVPKDLAHYFPSPEIKRSLKTRNPHDAKLAANQLEIKVLQGYSLLRFGSLPKDVIHHIVHEIMPTTRKSIPSVRTDRLLSIIITSYTAEKQAGWTDKTKMEVAGVFKMVVDILGDVEVSTITRPMLIELRSSLLRVPPNFYVKYRGQSVRDAIKSSSGPGLSIKTVNKHMARIGSLLKYCHELGYIANNPATGLQLSEKQRADQERNVYTPQDIKNIITNLPKDAEYPERYWIPLIGLYSGLRLNEICQLHIDDIVNIDGCWCFDINDTGNKRLKNSASARVIPIHPRLIDAGFISHYEQMKTQRQPRIWMNLSHIELHGYTNSIGKWYQRFNREYVSEDAKKVFHSMRHTVADTLKQKGVPEGVIAEILGHAHACITSSRYGKRYQPKVLLDALMQLDYGIQIPDWKP
jgi:integrase